LLDLLNLPKVLAVRLRLKELLERIIVIRSLHDDAFYEFFEGKDELNKPKVPDLGHRGKIGGDIEQLTLLELNTHVLQQFL
jgi:hypothetical protein